MNKIIALAGPTAVGKTKFAIKLADEFDGEIVSCDSMQLYKYMDIGSAKPTPEEMEQARHHLVDMIDPREEFSVAEYQRLAKQAISDIFSRGKLPVISGGTGLYLNSLLYDMDFSAAPQDQAYRQELAEIAEKQGDDVLHSMLAEQDPQAAAAIHPNNRKKVIRALERLRDGETRVRPFSGIKNETKDYDVLLIGLTRDRAELYERINRRVDILVEQGLFDEVSRLRDMGLTAENISMKGIGYKEILDFFSGKYSRDEAIDTIKKNTRHYAKKQLTWFRRYDKMNWYNISEFDNDDNAAGVIAAWVRKNL
ncbi:tRNA dimethylallyltransferase [uncultured Eubacterium sp.]|uniref:tRNA (adenosine(37)-N6)-dimethylallyltransferase MiaA n=1 Tax=Brotomerdimonas butyrica TaxID=2981721 RepID=UPI0008226648|nr:tRNA (adenosine(37)-N6)-dimethylallyltransferase MiaA [Brotomerdimonas butyrica]SCG98591.1 tRNA dimethylallyltransferase [uncultured Eubacterium sp.]